MLIFRKENRPTLLTLVAIALVVPGGVDLSNNGVNPTAITFLALGIIVFLIAIVIKKMQR